MHPLNFDVNTNNVMLWCQTVQKWSDLSAANIYCTNSFSMRRNEREKKDREKCIQADRQSIAAALHEIPNHCCAVRVNGTLKKNLLFMYYLYSVCVCVRVWWIHVLVVHESNRNINCSYIQASLSTQLHFNQQNTVGITQKNPTNKRTNQQQNTQFERETLTNTCTVQHVRKR